MPARLLTPRVRVTRCDPATLGISEVRRGEGCAMVGRQRARAGIDFGIAMARGGHPLTAFLEPLEAPCAAGPRAAAAARSSTRGSIGTTPGNSSL